MAAVMITQDRSAIQPKNTAPQKPTQILAGASQQNSRDTKQPPLATEEGSYLEALSRQLLARWQDGWVASLRPRVGYQTTMRLSLDNAGWRIYHTRIAAFNAGMINCDMP
jgi:hypothetical protein